MRLAWVDVSSALENSLEHLTTEQLRALERKVSNSIEQSAARRASLPALRDALNGVAELPKDTRLTLEYHEVYEKLGMGAETYLRMRDCTEPEPEPGTVIMWDKHGRMQALPARLARIAAENRERAQFYREREQVAA